MCLIVSVYSPLTFNVIIDMVELGLPFYYIFCLFLLIIIPLFFPACFFLLIQYFLEFHFNLSIGFLAIPFCIILLLVAVNTHFWLFVVYFESILCHLT